MPHLKCFTGSITCNAGIDVYGMMTHAWMGLTSSQAWYGLDTLGGLRKGQTVLVHSAAGGVGLAATEICKAKGARVLATVGSPEKVPLLKVRRVPSRTTQNGLQHLVLSASPNHSSF